MTPLDERKAVLRKAAEALVPHIDLLARVLTLEQGSFYTLQRKKVNIPHSFCKHYKPLYCFQNGY